MSPDKLFDYLDGKLSEEERARIEQQLASDSHLQREFAIAREIHARRRDGREILLTQTGEENRGAILGRRIAIGFAVLVFLNVVFGLYAIGFMEKKRRASKGEEQNRQQLVQALEQAAVTALPTPTLDISEIKITAPRKQRDQMANRIMAAAKASGGSAAKNLNDDNGLLLFAEIPIEHIGQFQDALRKVGAVVPAATGLPPTTGKIILQIRIVEGGG